MEDASPVIPRQADIDAINTVQQTLNCEDVKVKEPADPILGAVIESCISNLVPPATDTAGDPAEDEGRPQTTVLPSGGKAGVPGSDASNSHCSVFPNTEKARPLITYANRRKSWNVKPGARRQRLAKQSKTHSPAVAKLVSKMVAQPEPAPITDSEVDSKEWFTNLKGNVPLEESVPEEAEVPKAKVCRPMTPDAPYVTPAVETDVLDNIKYMWVYRHKTQGLFTYKRGRHRPPVETIRAMFQKAYEPVVTVSRIKAIPETSGPTPLPKLIRLDLQEVEERKRQRKSALEKMEIKSPCVYGLSAKKSSPFFQQGASAGKKLHKDQSKGAGDPPAKKALFSPVVEICLYPSEDEEEMEPQIENTISQKLEKLLGGADSEGESHTSEEGEIVWLGEKVEKAVEEISAIAGHDDQHISQVSNSCQPEIAAQTEQCDESGIDLQINDQACPPSKTVNGDRLEDQLLNETDNEPSEFSQADEHPDKPVQTAAFSPNEIQAELTTPPASPRTPVDDSLSLTDNEGLVSFLDGETTNEIAASPQTSIRTDSTNVLEGKTNKSPDMCIRTETADNSDEDSDLVLDRFSITPPPPFVKSDEIIETTVPVKVTNKKQRVQRRRRRRKITKKQEPQNEDKIPRKSTPIKGAEDEKQDVAAENTQEKPQALGEPTQNQPGPKRKRKRKQNDPLQVAPIIPPAAPPPNVKPSKRRGRQPGPARQKGTEIRTVRALLGKAALEREAAAATQGTCPLTSLPVPFTVKQPRKTPSISSRDSAKRARKPTQRLLESMESGWNYEAQWPEVENTKETSPTCIKTEPTEIKVEIGTTPSKAKITKRRKYNKGQLPTENGECLGTQNNMGSLEEINGGHGLLTSEERVIKKRKRKKAKMPSERGDYVGMLDDREAKETVPVPRKTTVNRPPDTESKSVLHDYVLAKTYPGDVLEKGMNTESERQLLSRKMWESNKGVSHLKAELQNEHSVYSKKAAGDKANSIEGTDVAGISKQEQGKLKLLAKVLDAEQLKNVKPASVGLTQKTDAASAAGVATPQVIFIPVAPIGAVNPQLVQPNAPVYFIRHGGPAPIVEPFTQPGAPLTQSAPVSVMGNLQYASPTVVPAGAPPNTVPSATSIGSGHVLVRCQVPTPAPVGFVQAKTAGTIPHSVAIEHKQVAVGQVPLSTASLGQPTSTLERCQTPKTVLAGKPHTPAGNPSQIPSPGEVYGAPTKSPALHDVHGFTTQSPTPSDPGIPNHQAAPRAHSRKSSLKVIMDRPIPAHSKPANFNMYSQLKCSVERPSGVAMGGLDLSKDRRGAESPQQQPVEYVDQHVPLALNKPVPEVSAQDPLPTSVQPANKETKTDTATGVSKRQAKKSLTGTKSQSRASKTVRNLIGSISQTSTSLTAGSATVTSSQTKPSQTARKSTTGRQVQQTPKKDVPLYADNSVVSQPSCNTCGEASMFICSGCRAVAYCSVKCQAAEWESHCKVCK